MTEEFKNGSNVDVNYEEIQSEVVQPENAQEESSREWHVGVSSDPVRESTQKKDARELHVGLNWESNESGEVKKVEWRTEFAPKRIFWGVLLVIAAIALILGQMGHLSGFMAGIGFWDIVLTIFFLVTLVEGITKGRIGEILFSVAFLINIHDELLGLEAITPWATLGAALLGTIGLKMIFPKAGRKHKGKVIINGVTHEGGICEETRKGNKITYENVFGSAVKYVAGEFGKVDVENAFGSIQIYFSDAQPLDGSAKVHLESAFGSVTLYVPEAWTVVDSAEHVFGGISEKGHSSGDGSTVLYVDGEVVFGSLQIRYI